MKIFYPDIIINEKTFINSGHITVKKNSVNLIVGRNGQGKTLLLSKIHLESSLDTCLISQKNNELIKSYSIRDNIILTNPDKYAIKKVTDTISRFGMDYILDSKTSFLSGGEKRIVALLRGILSPAEYILIDEPTNDLDYKKVALILELIKKTCAIKTYIIVTHDDRLKPTASTEHLLKDKKLIKSFIKDINNGIGDVDIDKNIHLKTNNNIRKFRGSISKKSKLYKPIINNFLLYFLLFASYIVFNFILEDTVNGFIPLENNLSERQVDIFSPLTAHRHNIDTSLPIALFNFLENPESVPTDSVLEEMLYLVLTEVNDLSLDMILNREDLDIIPIEFFDLYDRMFISPGNEYISYLGHLHGEIYLSFHPSMYGGDFHFNAIPENALYFHNVNLEDYLTFSSELLESAKGWPNYIIPTYLTIILDEGADFFYFITSAENYELLNSNFFIRSQLTIEILNQVQFLETARSARIHKIMLILTFFIISLASFAGILLSNRKIIIIFRNYGLAKEKVTAALNKKINGGLFWAGIHITNSILSSAVLRFHSVQDNAFFLFFPIGMITVIIIQNFLFRVITRRYVNKLYLFTCRI